MTIETGLPEAPVLLPCGTVSPAPAAGDSRSEATPLSGAAATALHAGSWIGYVTKMFPRISETFILDEVRALREAGLPLRIYSLLPPVRDARAHPEAEALAPHVTILPQPGLRTLPELVRALAASARRAPGPSLREVLRFVVWPSPAAFRQLFRGLVLADRLRRDDVAHVHAAWAHSPAAVTHSAARLTATPWSMEAHAKDVLLTRPQSLAARLRAARFTLVCSRAHQRLLQDIASRFVRGGPPPEIELIHHGVDVDTFSPGPELPSAGGPRILSVGRLVPKKGFEILLDAAARLRDRGIPFTLDIVGHGPLRPALERRIAALGLGESVRFRGMLVRHEVRDVMREARAFVLASRVTSDGDRDGIPNTLAEAMACGLPVVSTRLPAIEELVEDGRSGLLVPPDDPEALAAALETLLADASTARRFGAAARARVIESFDAQRSNRRRVERFRRCLRPTRALVLSADRGVPLRGHKGASVHLRSLVRGLEERGVEVRVLTTRAGGEAGGTLQAPATEARAGRTAERMAHGIALLLRGGPALERSLLRLADHRALMRAGTRLARECAPDLIYERYALGAVAGRLLAWRLRVPHLLEVNAPLADEEARFRGLAMGGVMRAMEAWLLRHADRVIVVSEPLAAWARGLGVDPRRLMVVPNAVDRDLFHPRRADGPVRAALGWNGSFVVGFAGSLKPWHGVARLIRALARLSSESDARLLVIGEGPERAALEREAERNGVAGRVCFAGAVSHERVPDHLAACDVLCAPYEPAAAEGAGFYFSPLKLAEYLAAGRPVVASAAGPLTAFGERQGVTLVPPGDEDALEAALAGLAADPERRGRLAIAAAKADLPTWSGVADRVLEAAAWERARRLCLPHTRHLCVGYVLKMFPRFSETFILNEILALERLGVDVVVFSMKHPNEPWRQPALDRLRASVRVLAEVPGGARVRAHLVAIARHPWRYLRTLWFVAGRRSASAWSKFALAPVLAREARRAGVEHLHAHFASGPARQAKLAAMIGGLPFSFTAHARDLFWNGHQHGSNHKLKKRVRLAAFVVAISDFNRRFVEGLGFKIQHHKVVTIPNGLDLETWDFARADGRPTGTQGAAPMILGVGRLVEKKGFHVLIEACRELRARGRAFGCVIAGEGPERTPLVDRVRRLGLEEVVTFVGAVPQDRLAVEWLARAHALAVPCVVGSDGDQDGVPTVILEAMATGLPVVSTPLSGIGEAVEHESSGLLVPPGDAAALADALERIVDDDALAARLARGGRRRVEGRFDLARSARALRALMKTAAHGARRPFLRDLRAALGLDPLDPEAPDVSSDGSEPGRAGVDL